MTQVRIGTSGWHYRHWLGSFYPEKLPTSKMFDFYQQHFDTVELNNSFYRLPEVTTFQCWSDNAPRNFLFAVKASRFITHNKKLKDPQNALDNFLPRAEALGEKLGPILFQLPPKWTVNLDRLEEFLSVLPRYHQYTFEFREPTWNTEETYALLRKYNAAYCIHELAGFHTPIILTADFTYVRLHGPGGKYQGSYSDAMLHTWAQRIIEWKHKLKNIYVYFDNDQAAYAAQNAFRLRSLVHESTRTAA